MQLTWGLGQYIRMLTARLLQTGNLFIVQVACFTSSKHALTEFLN